MTQRDSKAAQPIDIIAEATRTLSLEADAIRKAAARLSEAGSEQATQFKKAVETLNRGIQAGGKVIVMGIGKSGKIAQKIAATLSSTGSPAFFLHPTEALHGDLGFVDSKDMVLALSYTGNTEELLRIVTELKRRGTAILSLSGNPHSQLAKQSDAWIDASVETEACPHNLAPTTSTTLALALGDAIAISLMKLRGFDAHQFALNHPGGSLGRKLNLSVDEIMKKGSDVGVVSSDALMDQVVVLATQTKLGGVLVVDPQPGPNSKKLIGIITDGDIRRALNHREKFFSMKAIDVMTRSPVTGSPEMLAAEALALMENRPSQISVLPIVNPRGEWLGLLRLHDLLQTF